RPAKVKWRGKQRIRLHVNQVPAGQVSTERDSTLKGFSLAVLERQDIDAPAWFLSAVAKQDRAAARQNLREDVTKLALLPVQLCYWYGCAAAGGNPQQTALPDVQYRDDIAIVAPACAKG